MRGIKQLEHKLSFLQNRKGNLCSLLKQANDDRDVGKTVSIATRSVYFLKHPILLFNQQASFILFSRDNAFFYCYNPFSSPRKIMHSVAYFIAFFSLFVGVIFYFYFLISFYSSFEIKKKPPSKLLCLKNDACAYARRGEKAHHHLMLKARQFLEIS